MQDFIHSKVKTAEEFLSAFNRVQRIFAERSYEFDVNFDEFMKKLLDHYSAGGNTAAEAEVLKVINSVSLVKKGFNPVKMEKIQSGRREFYWGFVNGGLEMIHQLLTEGYTKEKIKLEEGEALISNLILNLYQNGILTDKKIKNLNSISKIESYWNMLVSQNDTISSINKKLRMTLMAEDIYLLFEKIIAKLI